MLRAIDNAHRPAQLEGGATPSNVTRSEGEFRQVQHRPLRPGCLLPALTEAGRRFIEVTTEYVPSCHWDTHENGHTTVKPVKGEIRPAHRPAGPPTWSVAACSDARW